MVNNTTSPAALSPAPSRSSLAIIVLILALIVGLPGNSFVVWSILAKMQKRSVTALMVLNLAVADLAVLLTAPFFLHYLARGTWIFQLFGCRLFFYICGVSMYASVLLITAMSLDRSLAVARPFVSQKLRTKTVARRVLAGIWVVSFLLATPVLVYRTVTVERDNRTMRCSTKYPHTNHQVFHCLFESITGFLLPFLVVVLSYSDIRRRLQNRRFHSSRRRIGRMVALIILAFAAFWLPYHAVILVDAGSLLAWEAVPKQITQKLNFARSVTIAVAFLSSSVNPVLYACAGGRLLRSAGLGFVAKLLEGTGSEASISRRGGTLNQTARGDAEPGPEDSHDTLG
ncbi:PREDICTED: leukotriene B4 receptor 1 [Condylura cristata]|uniref:leukotriene B4 receptor 1 n=1 Tax=Condylura cristata TaxID=143302 RepID=UPI0003343644|nr:PREDICTED: leukotriene B4 receptor 1 [Condylura cristata]XP_012589475.1 PREDICTED: leukotriene B4 receptor 1 [Condylura cristata]